MRTESEDLMKWWNIDLQGFCINLTAMCVFNFQVIYEDLSDISQLNDKMRASSLPHSSPLITRLIHYHKWVAQKKEAKRELKI